MSHVATIEIEVKDLDALAVAAKRCGLELVRGQTTYKWYGESVGDFPLPDGFEASDLGRCEHVLRIPDGDPRKDADAYEVGVTRRRDGGPGYVLLWDFFAGGYGLRDRIGTAGVFLRREYAAVVATKQAQQQGFRVTEQRLSSGGIKLLLSK